VPSELAATERAKPSIPPGAEYFDWALEKLVEAKRAIDGYQHELLDPQGVHARRFSDLHALVVETFRTVTDRLNYGASVMMSHALMIGEIQGRQPNGLGGKRILIVEDEPVLLHVLSTALSKRGARVFTAHSREEASRVIGAVQVHAALLDLRIPTPLDGLELARELRIRQPLTPVVIITGAPHEAIFEMETFAVLEKPCSLELLEKTLHEAIDAAAAAATPPAT
jgi:CheY-like chemotaxis protein